MPPRWITAYSDLPPRAEGDSCPLPEIVAVCGNEMLAVGREHFGTARVLVVHRVFWTHACPRGPELECLVLLGVLSRRAGFTLSNFDDGETA